MDQVKFNDRREWRKFGVAVGVILCLIASVQLLKGRTLYPYFFGVAAVFFTTAALIPLVLKPVFILFSYLGLVMGWVMTRVILGLVFFVIITPMGLVSRFFGKTYLVMKPEASASSYWLSVPEDDDRSHYEKQF
ncbi:MAG TPA: hypothetical protein ENN17_09750 [bacterium]|nr:hypothetical protein [bacterium]